MAALPRPEHPRPQFVRPDWINLNGEWRFAFDPGRSGAERGWMADTAYPDRIRVPFCPESRLSGIGRVDFAESVWYAREFAVPESWAGRDVWLRFGAVEYAATVWLDGAEVGRHQGGSSSFAFDLTAHVRPGRAHTLVVHALDLGRDGLQGQGKQSGNYYSGGCHYTRVTGIWQTVWLEAVHPEGLAGCRVTPLFDAGAFAVAPRFARTRRGHVFRAALFAEGGQVACAETPAVDGAVAVLAPPDPRPWSPDQPFLYDLVYEVRDADGRTLDRAESYAGLRTVRVEGGRVFLNDRPLFQRLVLDQGYYPDGVWTAPDDAALRRDIELGLAAGFNGARLHQKAFEERYHYWADRLGYLTWAEYPSWGLDFNQGEARGRFLDEWRALVDRDANHPSIVAWTPFNETCPPDPASLARGFPRPETVERYRAFLRAVHALTRQVDPTRPVNDASGYLHVQTDLWTVHLYRADAAALRAALRTEDGRAFVHVPDIESPYAGQPYLVDEWGGFKYVPAGRRDAAAPDGWGYHGLDPQTPDELCALIGQQLDVLLDDPGLAGYCYTQLTDVEQEVNGLYTYDREAKVAPEALRRLFGRSPARGDG